MQTQQPLRGDDLQALRADPPRDEEGGLAPWTLGHRLVENMRFHQAVEHRGLTLHDSTFRGFTWSGQVVIRGAVLRDLVLDQVAFTGLRFEDVTFERCHIDTLQLTDCEFLRCRFIGGTLTLLSASRCSFTDTRFEELRGDTWMLRDCTLTGSRLRACALTAPRLSKCTIDRLEIRGGSLHSAEFTLTQAATLHLAELEIRRLRVLGGEYQAIAFVQADGDDISLSTARIGELSFVDCPTLSGPRVLNSNLRALDIHNCPQVMGLTLHGCELGRLTLRRSTVQYGELVDVRTSGRLTMEDCALAGFVVRAGVWAELTLERCSVAEFIAVDHTRFTAVQTVGLVEIEGLQHQLDGQPATSTSFWGAIHGS